MIEKLLAFAGVAAVTGLGLAFTVGGCSSDTEALPNSGPEAGKSDVGSPVQDYPEPKKCGPKGEVMTPAGLDTKYGWKPPAAPQAACTEAELDAIEINIRMGQSGVDLAKGTSDKCRACAVSEKDAAHWAPIVTTSDDGKEGLANIGACVAVRTSPECGRAFTYMRICADEICKECSGTDKWDACYLEAAYATEGQANDSGGQCVAIDAELKNSCNPFATKLQRVLNECTSLVGGVRALCGARTGDGGTDAGGGDGGDEAGAGG